MKYQKEEISRLRAESQKYSEGFLVLQKSVRDYIIEANIESYPYNSWSDGRYILDREVTRIKEQRAQEAKEAEINALIKKALTDAELVKPEKTKK